MSSTFFSEIRALVSKKQRAEPDSQTVNKPSWWEWQQWIVIHCGCAISGFHGSTDWIGTESTALYRCACQCWNIQKWARKHQMYHTQTLALATVLTSLRTIFVKCDFWPSEVGGFGVQTTRGGPSNGQGCKWPTKTFPENFWFCKGQ